MATQHRYNAACAAALAGCGRGEDAEELDDAGHARWRQQALGWLRADLNYYSAGLKRTKRRKQVIVKRLERWLRDPDLVGVRDPEALTELADTEAKAWRALWAEVRALLAKAR